MPESNERPEDAPEFNAPDLPAFDPAGLPGAEVIVDDDDFTAVAVPVSALKGLGGAALPPELSVLLGLGGPDPQEVSMRQFAWALEELEAAKERHPDAVKTFEDSFVAVKPAPEHTLLLAPEEIYKAHARELFDRMADGADLTPATEGEIFGLLVDAFGNQPSCGGLTGLYLELSKRVVPEVYDQFLAEDPEETPETVAAFMEENRADMEKHRADIVELLSHERVTDDKDPATRTASGFLGEGGGLADLLSALTGLPTGDDES